MPRRDEEFEELVGRQFALEAMLTHLIWSWAKEQPHPPTALAGYLRPVEEGMARFAASQSPENGSIRAAQEAVRDIAKELEKTLQEASLRRAGGTGPVQ